MHLNTPSPPQPDYGYYTAKTACICTGQPPNTYRGVVLNYLLDALWSSEPLGVVFHQTTFAACIDVTQAAVSRALKQLVDDGYAVKIDAPAGRHPIYRYYRGYHNEACRYNIKARKETP